MYEMRNISVVRNIYMIFNLRFECVYTKPEETVILYWENRSVNI